ncbi:hypothetical protein ASG40_14840 [Methylobacterium sp. Leaf399]|uniref:DUF3572 domain-containing protein n=1 Tax=unclassified Methylobacterium TaxID=2615210 RepID=UPI0006F4EADD|nr:MULTISPECIES: DUF3572 domain-containing protein [unclassified Methylobacterium]KQP50264.1 hypothetical protein ASF39_13185 [Methylobacterium sp. Leaf108]KQT07346.1 hypothetical protein ASG40_14840 [Methylobacterium sp. Leaf399]KQT76967.1 hypothetical protein ASG59_13095 [Methylobacterium sp. Leaf466]
MKRKSDQGPDSAERLALAVLGWIAGDEDRLFPFLALTGMTPDTLRASAAEPGFLAGVLDFVMGDEAVLMACAASLEVPPERIAAAWRRLGPSEPDDGFA